jgi:23S rRNA (adenine2503-C2)-methyltransferase
MDEPAYRAKQIIKWIYKGQTEFEKMTDLPKDLIVKLKDRAYISMINIYKKHESTLDETVKYVFLLEDGNMVESVKMKYSFGNTACISSQVGCAMGCTFCASTEGGMVRNLSWGEMADEVIAIEKDSNEKVSRVVVMGSGEPLLNYDQIVQFIKVMNSSLAFNISCRRLTVSTCGIIPGIIRLADEGMPITLAVSCILFIVSVPMLSLISLIALSDLFFCVASFLSVILFLLIRYNLNVYYSLFSQQPCEE